MIICRIGDEVSPMRRSISLCRSFFDCLGIVFLHKFFGFLRRQSIQPFPHRNQILLQLASHSHPFYTLVIARCRGINRYMELIRFLAIHSLVFLSSYTTIPFFLAHASLNLTWEIAFTLLSSCRSVSATTVSILNSYMVLQRIWSLL